MALIGLGDTPFRRLPRKAYFGKGVLCLQLGGERQESSTTLPKRKRLNDPIVVKEVIGEVPSDVVRSVAYALGVRGGGEEQESCVLDPASGQDEDATGDAELVPRQRLYPDAAQAGAGRLEVESRDASVKQDL